MGRGGGPMVQAALRVPLPTRTARPRPWASTTTCSGRWASWPGSRIPPTSSPASWTRSSSGASSPISWTGRPTASTAIPRRPSPPSFRWAWASAPIPRFSPSCTRSSCDLCRWRSRRNWCWSHRPASSKAGATPPMIPATWTTSSVTGCSGNWRSGPRASPAWPRFAASAPTWHSAGRPCRTGSWWSRADTSPCWESSRCWGAPSRPRTT